MLTKLVFFFSVEEGNGIHWFVLCRREPLFYEIFNSLGTSEEYVRAILSHLAGECEFNETPVQAVTSKACGLFCIFCVIERYFNEDLDLEALLNDSFTNNFVKNEEMVKDFFAKENFDFS